MRSYSVAVASLAIHAPPKWTDNAITQHAVTGVLSARRGVARRLSFHAVLILGIARELHSRLSIPVGDAIRIAASAALEDLTATVPLGAVTLLVHTAEIRRLLELRLSDAMETAPTPRRGRRPRASQA